MRMLIRKIASFSIILVLVIGISGCTSKGTNPSNQSAQQEAMETAANKEKAVMDSYNALVQQQSVTIPEIIKYIDDNYAAVSQGSLSTMVIGLEKVQNEKLPKLQDKFADGETFQKILTKSFQNGVTDNAISNIENKEVKDLVLDTKNSGFKIETAEGMYFPVIDYSFYKKYRNAVSQDVAAFIDIMAVESDKTPAKDAALTISWAEILRRAMVQEKFIKEYGNSAKVEDMQKLLKRYTVFALYGANNTPLFSYDTKEVVPGAKKVYLETTFDANAGSFSKVMSDYLILLKKNDYKLTQEVQEYRNKVTDVMR